MEQWYRATFSFLLTTVVMMGTTVQEMVARIVPLMPDSSVSMSQHTTELTSRADALVAYDVRLNPHHAYSEMPSMRERPIFDQSMHRRSDCALRDLHKMFAKPNRGTISQ